MASDEFMQIVVKVSNAEILEKLKILRLERGISNNSFIIASIAEKLKREGYLQEGVQKHDRVVRKKKPSGMDDLLASLRKIDMHKSR